MTNHHNGKSAKFDFKKITQQFCAAILLGGWVFTAACTTTQSVSHPIYEDPDTLVRLEPIRKTGSISGIGFTHPVSFTPHQIKILLASLSGREKIGLLSSFTGSPDLPRLLEQTDIDILSRPLQDAFSRVNPEECIVFYRAKNGSGTRQLVTSGMVVIQGDNLIVSIANFWHPLLAVAFEVGGTDKLHDIRETISYVREFPWISVGEQDFAVFFDDPRYQGDQRHGALFGFPERTVSIAYQSYLEANSDPDTRRGEIEEVMQQDNVEKAESQTIADMQKRIAELEQANGALRAKMERAVGAPSPSPLSTPEPTFKNIQKQDVQAQLQERVNHLERRMADLEKKLNGKVKARNAGVGTN